jgi:hypothetical protein
MTDDSYFSLKKIFFRIIVRNTNEAGEDDNQYIFARFRRLWFIEKFAIA